MSYLSRKSLAFFYLLSFTIWLMLIRHFPFMEEFFLRRLTRLGLDAITVCYLLMVIRLFWGRADGSARIK